MIVVEGRLTMKSAESTVEIHNEGTRLICDIKGWPKQIPLRTIRQVSGKLQHQSLQPIDIRYNGKPLGEYSGGKIRKWKFKTFANVFYSYLKSKF